MSNEMWEKLISSSVRCFAERNAEMHTYDEKKCVCNLHYQDDLFTVNNDAAAV